jgi:ATP-dependent Clp protease ATP-binding subunit ClpA
MTRIPWDRLKIDIEVKSLSDDECRDILKNRMYRNLTDYKFYVCSKCIYDFPKLIKQLRIYSAAYGVEQEELLEDLYRFCCEVNPVLTVKKRKATGAKSCGLEEEDTEPKQLFDDLEIEEVLSLGDRVKQIVIGQDPAIDKIVEAVQRAKAGLRDPEQPIGSFLLTGPTGVGKTYFAKTLAQQLTGEQDSLIRIDCSEYQSQHEYAKLIGAPHGYIGFEQGGILTGAIGRNPFAVVLFDEIEKAHDKVYNLLLQMMDEGALTSNVGKRYSFKDAIILLTSNLGVAEAEKVAKEMGFMRGGGKITYDQRIESMEAAMKKTFKPEFINRLDETAHFMPLVKDECKHIVVLELHKLLVFLKGNKNIIVNYEQDVIDLIHDVGFDEVFGARPLRRAIRKHFANPLSSAILAEEVADGSETTAYVEDDVIKFK